MSLLPPNFNLLANIWRVNGTAGAYATPDLTLPCFTSPGRRVLSPFSRSAGFPAPYFPTSIGFPKLSDVRANYNGLVQDLIECPAGSKRFYSVEQVDDVGKGHLNEYRLVLAFFQYNGNNTLAGGPFLNTLPLP